MELKIHAMPSTNCILTRNAAHNCTSRSPHTTWIVVTENRRVVCFVLCAAMNACLCGIYVVAVVADSRNDVVGGRFRFRDELWIYEWNMMRQSTTRSEFGVGHAVIAYIRTTNTILQCHIPFTFSAPRVKCKWLRTPCTHKHTHTHTRITPTFTIASGKLYVVCCFLLCFCFSGASFC